MPIIALAQFTICDTTDITASATAPVGPVLNQLWLDTSVTPNQLKRYSGTSWTIVNDPSALSAAIEAANAAANDAMNAANDAQTTANEAMAAALSVKNEIIVGTQTAATAAWTGIAGFSSLDDGQEITYWLPQTSASNATLNLTLSGGNKTGAVPIYYGGTTRMAKQYAAGNIIHLTYRENVTIGTTTIAKGWWADANYDTNTYDRIRLNNSIYCRAAIAASRLIVSDADGYDALKSSVAFDVTKPILWLATATTAAGNSANGYLSYPSCTLRNNLAGFTGVKDKTCYLRGFLEGNIFTPTDSMFTTDIPVDEDGLTYMALGVMYSTYQIYLYPEHPMYMLVDGVFKSLNQVAYDAQVSAHDAQVASTENAASIATLNAQISMTVRRTEYDADRNALEQRVTQVEQTASEFKVEVSRTIANEVANVTSEVENIGQGLDNFRETVTGYMGFNGDSLSIGVNGSNFKTEITNTEMAFKESGEKVAYISNSDMYITRARVTDTLSVGTVDHGYFDFVTMAGGLALKWRSGAGS